MDAWQRISDTDRDRATADLGRHYAEGRLEHDEYDERLDAIWTARTAADLAVVFHDLPRLPAPAPARAVARSRPRTRVRDALLPLVMLLLALGALLVLLDLVPWWLVVVVAVVVLSRRKNRRRQHACQAPPRR